MEKVEKSVLRKILLVVLFIACFFRLGATHNRAGEITYVQLSDLTYEITIQTFTYTLSYADRPQLTVQWGDNTSSVAQRQSILFLPNFYKRNIYKITHTYPGPGVYKILVQDPNRNANVLNIPNSVNVVFSISTTLIVNPAIGRNSTPVLLNPPYDKAARGYVFIHNPGAFDPDGDSLSYAITVCTRDDGKPIENYTLPPATSYIRVDSITGDLIWNTPRDTGKYNVAMNIIEWRYGRKIGVVERDMQIEVYDTKNKPPVNGPLRDMCVQVGDVVDFDVTSTDPDGDGIGLHATSGIFSIASCPATFTSVDSVAGFASARLLWTPCYETVRNQPYDVVIKSDDYSGENVRLSDIDIMKIRVLGPSPSLLTAVPVGKFIKLAWSNYGTGFITGFNIYRKEGNSSFKPDSCTSGIPSSTGFVKVGYAEGSSAITFTDTNNGEGLEYGKEYAYRIVAVYPNGAESKTSNEILTSLVSGVPLITHVSVTATSSTAGTIYVSWRKPDRLDTIPANGPYEYIISRAAGVAGTSYQEITRIETADLNDTVFTDTQINTLTSGYIYRIELYNNAAGNRFLIGEPAYASSLYLTAAPGDRKARLTISRNVPWINSRYDIFRLNEATSRYDSIGTTNQLTFTDPGLINGTQYCYYVRSTGAYPGTSMPRNLQNLSETVCVTPIDNEAPCSPVITVTSQCDSLYNTIRWSIADQACFADVAGYKVYYKGTGDTTLVATINDRNTFTYRHEPGEIITGCYAVSAFDSAGNESKKSAAVCTGDACSFYEIPNVFTPNGDGFNDKLVAKTSGLVERINFKLFNRYGVLVFQTTEPKINWDGYYNGKIVSPGVYFYQCDVFERKINGIEQFHLAGFVHVITEPGATNKQQL